MAAGHVHNLIHGQRRGTSLERGAARRRPPLLSREISAAYCLGWVCAVLADVFRRRNTLSFHHHKVVASLPLRQQDLIAPSARGGRPL